jgi:hypothetical protein
MDFSLDQETLKLKEDARAWVHDVLDPLSGPL